MNGQEKSDPGTVVVKPTNKAGRPAAESVEPRPGTEGTAGQQSTHRAQNRARVTQALERVRNAAKLKRKERFTALLHHITVDMLRTAFYALQRKAAPGVDCVTWRDYEANLEPWLCDLHARVHGGVNRHPNCPPIGVQDSYDLFQAQSACAIDPVSCEARMNMFGEAEVRTPA